MTAGDIALYTEGSDSAAITTTRSYMSYSATTKEDSIYSMNVANTRVTCSEGGHYLALWSDPFSKSNQASPTRGEIHYHLNINNGTFPRGGRDSGYWRDAEGLALGYVCGAAIVDLTGSDDIGISAFRTDSAGVPGSTVRDQSMSDASLALLKLDDAWDYIALRATGSGTATTSSFADYTWDAQDELDTGSWDHSTSINPEEIEFVTGGHKLIFVSMVLNSSSTVDRALGEMRLMLNGGGGFAEVIGARSTAYARGANSCQTNVAVFMGILSVDAGDILKVQYRHEHSSAGVTLTPGTNCGLTAVALPDDADYFSVYDAGGGQAADADSTLDYDTTDEEDTDSFDHDGATDVDIQQDLWLLSFYACYAFPTGSRNANRIGNSLEMRENSILIGYGRCGAYNRGSNQNCRTSGMAGGALIEVEDADAMQIRHDAYGSATDTALDFQTFAIAWQGVNVGTLFPLFENVDETEEIEEEAEAAMAFNREVSETEEIPEEVVRVIVFAREVSEDEEVEEEVLRVFAFNRNVDEDEEIEEGVERLLTLHHAVTEDVELVEEAVRAVTFARNVDEDEEIVENTVRALTFLREVSEDEEIPEEVLAQLGFVASVDETVEVLEEVESVLQRLKASRKGDTGFGGSECGSTAKGASEAAETAYGGAEMGDAAQGGSEQGADPKETT